MAMRIIWDDSAIEQKLAAILATLQTITSRLNTVITKENAMALDLTAATAEIERNTQVTAGVLQLVQTLVTELQNIPPSTDPVTQAALDDLVKTLTTNDQSIADAVAANTPAAPVTAPVPKPAPSA